MSIPGHSTGGCQTQVKTTLVHFSLGNFNKCTRFCSTNVKVVDNKYTTWQLGRGLHFHGVMTSPTSVSLPRAAPRDTVKNGAGP